MRKSCPNNPKLKSSSPLNLPYKKMLKVIFEAEIKQCTIVIIQQYLCISNQHVMFYKLIYVNYISKWVEELRSSITCVTYGKSIFFSLDVRLIISAWFVPHSSHNSTPSNTKWTYKGVKNVCIWFTCVCVCRGLSSLSFEPRGTHRRAHQTWSTQRPCGPW